MKKIDKDKREFFIDSVFAIIESTEANNITEITENLFKTSSKMIQYYKNMDSETKEILFETIKIFIKSAKDTVQNSVQEKIQEYQGTLHLNP